MLVKIVIIEHESVTRGVVVTTSKNGFEDKMLAKTNK